MSEQNGPPTQNQRNAAFFVLADELTLPETTIAWISSAVTDLSERKSLSGSHSNAREVCSALLRDLNVYYSGQIEAGLREVQISCSEDVGRVVWGLVSKQVIQPDPEDSVSHFDGLFRIDDLDRFLSAEGIQRASFSWIKCKQYLSWMLYLVGTLIVISSYAGLVSQKISMIGWTLGLIGFVLGQLPDPKRKRF